MNLLRTTLILFITTLQLFATSYNIKDFGAKGDKKNNDNIAIQKAVDLCAAGGGGTVYFPSGNYLIGSSIQLKNSVQIYLDTGVILWENPDSSSWIKSKSRSIFYANEAEHFSIIGPGTIQGNGRDDLCRRSGIEQLPTAYKVTVMQFKKCNNVLIRDITINNSNAQTIELTYCENIRIDAVTIKNNFYRINTNGIISTSSKSIMVSNCNIVAGDDCIALKSISGKPNSNITINNCILESISAAIKIGSRSFGNFKDIHINNCAIRNSGIGIGIIVKDGACVERFCASNISIETSDSKLHTKVNNQRCPLLIDIKKRQEDSPIGKIRDITFSNIHISSDVGIIMQGLPESAIENLTLSNISFRANGLNDFYSREIWKDSAIKRDQDTLYIRKPSYFTIAYAKGLHINNITVTIPDIFSRESSYSAFGGYYIKNAVIQDIMRLTPAKINTPLIVLGNCKDMLISNTLIENSSDILLEIQGKKSKDIMLNMPRLKKIKNKIIFTDKAPMRALVR
jgi:polygalacturonase